MNKTKIEWCDYTLNPVVGCLRGCDYCYAKKTHNKRHMAYRRGKLQNHKQYRYPFNIIQYFPERLKISKKLPPSKIFVGSVSDIEFWTKNCFIVDLRAFFRNNKKHTFMLLSKNYLSYSQFSNWPDNCILGLTINFLDYRNLSTVEYFLKCYKRTFLSIEPLLGKINKFKINNCERIFVGAMKCKNAIKPKPEWIKSIRDNVPEEKIFWKDNIKKY